MLNGELIRHLSPLTIKKIVSNLPMSQLINNYQNKFIYINIGYKWWIEKPKINLRREILDFYQFPIAFIFF